MLIRDVAVGEVMIPVPEEARLPLADQADRQPHNRDREKLNRSRAGWDWSA